jgi:type IV secretory pathway VirB10-like protein
MRFSAMLPVVALAAAFTVSAIAQQPPAGQSMSSSLGVVVFPAQGQAADKQAADEGECYAWSKGQTGIDPMAPPPPPQQQASAAPPPPPPAATGARVRGAARGAAAGAVIGEIADNDASKGAEVGAAVGVMKGGAASRQQKAAQQQQAQQQQAQAQQQAQQQSQATQQANRDTFNKGFAACLEAKGYTVK